MNKLLPETFEEDLVKSIKVFWESRSTNSSSSQKGGRGAVISGKNLDGFSQIIRNIAVHCGLPASAVEIFGRKAMTVPGYFRPTKMWDAIVFHKGHLLAAFELKSQVGSFGNNFNNRSEESIGSAVDFWTAHREKAFSAKNLVRQYNFKVPSITIQPFLGYLMLLEESEASTSPVKIDDGYFRVFTEFNNASYSERYHILLDRLVSERLYNSACLILSDKDKGLSEGYYNILNEGISPRSLFSSFAGHLLAAIEVID
jgi:hypothetical protein